MIKTFCLASLIVLATTAPSLEASPQCGTSLVENFEGYSNEGNWVFNGIFHSLQQSGGNPGWYVRSQPLQVSTPRFQTTNPGSLFCGDWRARAVTSVGIDVLTFDVGPGAEGRELNVVLYFDNGTPGDATDDPFVYRGAGSIPERDGNWRSYTVDVPTASPVLPLGWAVGGPWSGTADALWNLVVADVQRVAWVVGSPTLEAQPADFRFGMDNPRLAFADGPSTYCVAQRNSLGCSPSMLWGGTPSATSLQTFLVFCSEVRNESPGLLIYGFAPAEVPLFGGLRCVAQPLRRTGVQSSGGTPTGADCSGVLFFEFNTLIQSGVDPLLVPGATVYAQFWSRDIGAPDGVSFTNALRFTICP